jgi:hypothetical protein
MKILLYATSPNQVIGYAKISNILSNYLASQSDIQVYFFSTGNFVDTRVNRFIDSRIIFIDILKEEKKRGITHDWGVDFIEETLLTIQPDIFLIYNDLVITCRLFNKLLQYRLKYKHITKFICYIDLVYPYEKLEFIKHMDRNTDLIYVFTNYWKQNLINMGISEDKIKVFNHGINTKLFYDIPKSEARKKLSINEDDFVVLNTNRNCYRKATDITISAFINFFKLENKNPKIKLFLNCYLHTKAGYDLMNVIKIECIKHDVSFDDIQSQIIYMGNDAGKVSDETINLIYNACDVGINTCIGEGFGLCNFEHAYVGRPQIVSKVGGLQDIFSNDFSYVVEPAVTISATNLLDDHCGDISFCDYRDFTKGMQYYYHNRDKLEEHGSIVKKHITDNYDWSKLLNRFMISLRLFMSNHSGTPYYSTSYSN